MTEGFGYVSHNAVHVLFMCPQLRQVDTKLYVEHGRTSKIITSELSEKTGLIKKGLKEFNILTLSGWRSKMFLNDGKLMLGGSSDF